MIDKLHIRMRVFLELLGTLDDFIKFEIEFSVMLDFQV